MLASLAAKGETVITNAAREPEIKTWRIPERMRRKIIGRVKALSGYTAAGA